MSNNHAWWQTDIIYQIYPRSYQDTNQDGVGDLPGILQRLDYVKSLNIGAIWLSPINPSPMHDFGYDVADYCDVHPLFGTLEDFDRMLEGVHARGMKLILDLVPNHTSDEHVWFQESRSSRDNPKRDWYIWQDPAADGGPPNNWTSFFGGPAWTLDEHTGQYYLHQFVKQQPELNYRNPAVMQAMLDQMRFWLDRGVDGFRVDVIWLMIKDELLRDEPDDPAWDRVNPHARLLHIHTADQPEVHDLIRQMRALLDAYDDRMMVGEIYLPNQQLMTYYGAAFDEVHLPFNFQLILARWEARTVRRLVDQYEADLPTGGWPNWVLGNHDQHRVATRVGAAQARVANMLLLTLRGTPTCYYGDELGMENVLIPPEFVQDPPAVNQPEIAHLVGRDPERTPMQWDASPNAGFTAPGVQPWLPLSDDYAQRNVAIQSQDPRSMLAFFRTLSALRRDSPALSIGAYQSIDTGVENIFAYTRTHADERLLILLNFAATTHRLDLSRLGSDAEILLSTGMESTGKIRLRALYIVGNEGIVLRLP
ncbi:MAG: alpha-glucosidase C-terminal domain-containing protein [Caldilineaceae bacterium]|nr:alpha-glucosidase C-terminal domain-containing protein [Caldilineaceae bacterium]